MEEREREKWTEINGKRCRNATSLPVKAALAVGKKL